MGREEMLKNVEIFSELGRRDLERVGKLMVPRQIRAGEVIIKEGDQAAGFFVINSGKVEVVQDADGSNPQQLATLGPGDFFGEMALVDQGPRSATVKADSNVKLLVLGEREFSSLIDNVPAVAKKILRGVAARLRTYQESPAA